LREGFAMGFSDIVASLDSSGGDYLAVQRAKELLLGGGGVIWSGKLDVAEFLASGIAPMQGSGEIVCAVSGYDESDDSIFEELKDKTENEEALVRLAEKASWNLRGETASVSSVIPFSAPGLSKKAYYVELTCGGKTYPTLHFLASGKEFLAGMLEKNEVGLFAAFGADDAEIFSLALGARKPVKPLFVIADKSAIEELSTTAAAEIRNWRKAGEYQAGRTLFSIYQAPVRRKEKSKQNLDPDMAKLLEELTVDCKDNGEKFVKTKRLDAIEAKLAKTPYRRVKFAGNSLSYVYEHKDLAPGADVVLISTNVDSFYQKHVHEEKEKRFAGTYNNSATNAAVLCLMEKGLLGESAVVAFTGNEAVSCAGAHEVAEKYIKKSGRKVRCAIVCGLTNEGWKDEAFFSVENDFACAGGGPYSSLKLLQSKIKEAVSKVSPEYPTVHTADLDETFIYKELGFAVFALRLPAKGKLRGKKGVKLRKKSLGNYALVLAELAQVL
jgi:hypothetical protein